MYNENMKRNNWLFLLFFLANGFAAVAQNGINSPFSQYGIGFSNLPYNVPAVSALGGVAYTNAASNMVNPFNPASYAAVKQESFVFDMGFCLEMATLRDNQQSVFDADGNIGYLTVAFPLTRWWKTALGVMPLSDVNYYTVNVSPITPGGEVKTMFEGVGGVSQFFWGNGFNILGGDDNSKPQLRAGFNLNLLYGSDTSAVTFDFTANDTTYFMNSRRQRDLAIRGAPRSVGKGRHSV